VTTILQLHFLLLLLLPHLSLPDLSVPLLLDTSLSLDI
jgi:hypothetical protein